MAGWDDLLRVVQAVSGAVGGGAAGAYQAGVQKRKEATEHGEFAQHMQQLKDQLAELQHYHEGSLAAENERTRTEYDSRMAAIKNSMNETLANIGSHEKLQGNEQTFEKNVTFPHQTAMEHERSQAGISEAGIHAGAQRYAADVGSLTQRVVQKHADKLQLYMNGLNSIRTEASKLFPIDAMIPIEKQQNKVDAHNQYTKTAGDQLWERLGLDQAVNDISTETETTVKGRHAQAPGGPPAPETPSPGLVPPPPASAPAPPPPGRTGQPPAVLGGQPIPNPLKRVPTKPDALGTPGRRRAIPDIIRNYQ